LKVADIFLEFPFEMDGLEDMPFSSVDLLAMMNMLWVVGVKFIRKRLTGQIPSKKN